MSTTRRDAGRPRGRPIEEAIVSATLQELALHGLEGLSIPRVAAAAEVNKTTVYRRWPTREALVAAALGTALREIAVQVEDTGTLRGDLAVLVQIVATRMGSPEGRALVRAALGASFGGVEPGVPTEDREHAAILALVARAAARGEWDPARHAPEAVLAMVTGSVMHRVLMEQQPMTPSWAEAVVDVVVRGLAV
jgi:AcrR family transcriptional regulator